MKIFILGQAALPSAFTNHTLLAAAYSLDCATFSKDPDLLEDAIKMLREDTAVSKPQLNVESFTPLRYPYNREPED